jgi:hypothetical protein
MNTYLRAIQTRLKNEVLEGTKDEEKWLMEMLNENDWWIRHQQAESLCKKLGVIFAEIAYYRDVYVWLPEQRWGCVAWPPCPSCLQQNKIGARGWQKNHYARRVVTMNSNYFVMSRRYMCHSCNRDYSKNSQESTQIQQASFMGYNPKSRCRLPFGLGYYSDPPGFFSFYTNHLDKKGEPMVDQFGIALLDCNRGTNDIEAIHKQLVALYGTWCTGVEMSDALLSGRRHRYNQKINERKRLGFPKIGHYDTWKIDVLQLLVERNHDVLLYPDWSNASDYKETAWYGCPAFTGTA